METQQAGPCRIDVVYRWDGALEINTDFDLAIPKSISAMGGSPKQLKQSLIEAGWGVTPDAHPMFKFILRLCDIQGINDIAVRMNGCMIIKHWLATGDAITNQVLAALTEEYKISEPTVIYGDQPLGPPLTQADLDSLM